MQLKNRLGRLERQKPEFDEVTEVFWQVVDSKNNLGGEAWRITHLSSRRGFVRGNEETEAQFLTRYAGKKEDLDLAASKPIPTSHVHAR